MRKYLLLIFFLMIPLASALDLHTDGEIPDYISILLYNESGENHSNANGDYSGKTIDFIYQPPVGTVSRLARIIITLEDLNINNPQDYGAISGGLNHGVAFYVKKNGTERRIDGGENFTQNGDYHKVSYDVDFSNLGNGDDYVTVRWTFANSGTEIRLDGNNNDSIIARLHDDFTGLQGQWFMVQGYNEIPEEENNMIFLIFIPLIVAFFFLYWSTTLEGNESKHEREEGGDELATDHEWLKWFMRFISIIFIFITYIGADIYINLFPAYANFTAIFSITPIRWIFYSLFALFLVYVVFRIFSLIKIKEKQKFDQGKF